MPTDRDEATLERHGRSVRAAYRSARLTPSQHDRHRARLADRYGQSSGRWTRFAGAAVAVGILILLVAMSFVVWSDLTQEESRDVDDDEAVVAALPTDTDAPRETAFPSASATSPDPTVSPISRESLFGFYESTGACRTTPNSGGQPRDASQAAFTDTWYGYGPEGLWAGLGRENEGVWTTTNRVLWWRGNAVPIEVTGRRLDGDAPPLDADLTDGYDGLSHQFSVLTFPEPGCWEIEASAGDDLYLRIVADVVPYEESPGGIRVQQEKDAVIAERETFTPFAVPDTCPASAWAGPESRVWQPYPASIVGDDEWRHTYFLDGENLSLNTRLGFLVEGENTLVWLSAAGTLPESTVMTATKPEEDGTITTLPLEPPGHSFVVQSSQDGFLTVHGMALTFPSSGCWTLTVEGDDVSFSHTVYVYPREDLEAIHAAIAEREAMRQYPPPGTCHHSEAISPEEWAGPENRTGGWFPASIAANEDWGYAYYMEGENVTLISRRGVLYEGPNTLVWITASDQPPTEWRFTATLLESPGQFGIGGMERMGFESTTIDDPQNPGSTLAVHGQSLKFDIPGCWILSVRSDEASFNHYFYVYPRVDREAALDNDRLYVVDVDGRVWGWDLEVEARNLFQISTGDRVSATLSPDGTRLYLVTSNSMIALDALTGAELWRTPVESPRHWQGESGPPNIAVSSDEQRIFVASIEKQDLPWVQIFDAGDGSKLADTDTLYGNCPANMHMSPDGRTLYLVCITTEEGVKVVDLKTGESSDLLDGQFASSAISPDGRLLYAVTTSQRLFTIDMDSREVLSEIELDLPAPPEKFLQIAAVSPDGLKLFIGLGREREGDGPRPPWEDVREIATIDLTDGSTVEVFEADFMIDRQGLEVDNEGKLYVNSAGRIMRLAGGEAEALRFFVEMDVRQFLIATPEGQLGPG